jgi:hypothetical protein
VEVKIDYSRLNEFKEIFKVIQTQIANDYIAEKGSYLAKEDLMSASIVCLLTNTYSTVS